MLDKVSLIFRCRLHTQAASRVPLKVPSSLARWAAPAPGLRALPHRACSPPSGTIRSTGAGPSPPRTPPLWIRMHMTANKTPSYDMTMMGSDLVYQARDRGRYPALVAEQPHRTGAAGRRRAERAGLPPRLAGPGRGGRPLRGLQLDVDDRRLHRGGGLDPCARRPGSPWSHCFVPADQLKFLGLAQNEQVGSVV